MRLQRQMQSYCLPCNRGDPVTAIRVGSQTHDKHWQVLLVCACLHRDRACSAMGKGHGMYPRNQCLCTYIRAELSHYRGCSVSHCHPNPSPKACVETAGSDRDKSRRYACCRCCHRQSLYVRVPHSRSCVHAPWCSPWNSLQFQVPLSLIAPAQSWWTMMPRVQSQAHLGVISWSLRCNRACTWLQKAKHYLHYQEHRLWDDQT